MKRLTPLLAEALRAYVREISPRVSPYARKTLLSLGLLSPSERGGKERVTVLGYAYLRVYYPLGVPTYDEVRARLAPLGKADASPPSRRKRRGKKIVSNAKGIGSVANDRTKSKEGRVVGPALPPPNDSVPSPYATPSNA